MNRRDAMGFFGGFASGLLGFPEVPSAEKKFTIIDKRLSGKIRIKDLEDGEAGYLSSMFYRDTNNISYVSFWSHPIIFSELPPPGELIYHPSVGSITSDFSMCLVGRRANNFYLEAIDPKYVSENQNLEYLAGMGAYPIVEKEDKYFIIPRDKSKRAENPIVKRNLEKLKSMYPSTMGAVEW